MINDKYKLAVVIPCWNCSNVIGPLLDTIISQTFHDWKVFCVDDNSTDDTIEVLQSYSTKDNRIIVVSRNREPKGAQTCRNIGFDQSIGADYVIWFDSDDLIAPYCFEQRVDFMDKHPELDFGVFPAKSFTNDLWELEGSILFGVKVSLKDDLCRFLIRTLPFVGWTNIYRRSSIVEKGLHWDENILSLQDSDFNIQSILLNLKYDYAPDGRIDYFWRIMPSSGSISTKIATSSHKKSHLYLLDKIHSTMPSEALKRYSDELDIFLFFFIDMFLQDGIFIDEILSHSWIRHREWFKFRIHLYCRIKRKKLKYMLFPYMSFRKRYIERQMRKIKRIQKVKIMSDLSKYFV